MTLSPAAASAPRLFHFVGGSAGGWRIVSNRAIHGTAIGAASHLAVVAGSAAVAAPADGWALRGITSNERYVVREEKAQLVDRQEGLGRPSSTFAALIPVRKTAAWWALTQDERRDIFEAKSAHIGIGLRYLPAIARRLHHCRDLDVDAPFDFLTWFEYAPSDEAAFDDMLLQLRATPEWRYVEREVDIRLVRENGTA